MKPMEVDVDVTAGTDDVTAGTDDVTAGTDDVTAGTDAALDVCSEAVEEVAVSRVGPRPYVELAWQPLLQKSLSQHQGQ